MAAIPRDDEFLGAWNQLPRTDRLRVRRLVRLGRRLESPEEAAIAVAYGRFQRARPWERYFWLWFVPGLVVALGIAVTIHPVVVGVVLALSAQAVLTHRNLARVEHVNAAVLGPDPP